MQIVWKKRPRRGHIHHHWTGFVNDYSMFFVQKTRGHVYMDHIGANKRTEHASVEAAQSYAQLQEAADGQ
jgi:hypothetical protein